MIHVRTRCQVLTLDPTQPLRMKVTITYPPINVIPLAPAKGASLASAVAMAPGLLFTPAAMLRDYGNVQSSTVTLDAAPVAGPRPVRSAPAALGPRL